MNTTATPAPAAWHLALVECKRVHAESGAAAATTLAADYLARRVITTGDYVALVRWSEGRASYVTDLVVAAQAAETSDADAYDIPRETVQRVHPADGTLVEWVHGTTTYSTDGRAFIARDAEGFELFSCRVPFGVGTLVATCGSLAAAKRLARGMGLTTAHTRGTVGD